MAKTREIQGRVLQSTQIGDYNLLSSEKLGRVLDLLEGNVQPKDEEAGILAAAKKLGEKKAILALYDRLGGAIKLGDRKLALGTFYDFAAKEPRAEVHIAEESFEDEYVLQKKKTRKSKKDETPLARVKRLEAKAQKSKKE